MARRPWSLAQVALVGVLLALFFPADGLALRAVFIELTSTGPSPAVMTIAAGLYPVWLNQDTVTHTVVFANGLCSIQVSPGTIGQCTSFSPGSYVGSYAYTVDNTYQGSIVTVADSRNVSLSARRHTIRPGSELLLHGTLTIATLSPPVPWGPRQPVMLLARPDRYHPFHRIAVVTAKPLRKPHFPPHSVWHLRVRPKARTIYIAEANFQPKGGQVWQQAWSKPFRVRVGR